MDRTASPVTDRAASGSVDPWIFGGTNIAATEGRPTISPDAVRAHNAAPGGPATHPPAGNPPTTAAPGPPTTRHGATGGESASPSAPATTPSPWGDATAAAARRSAGLTAWRRRRAG